MDKYEYKVRAEEIKTLIEERRYPEAMAIADTIDWRKVKSVSMLCDISDLYNVNRRYDVARDVLELAYERHPEGRRIVYSLCELSIKMEDIIQAVEYYKEFVKIAPRDSGRFILQYKIYQAQEVGLDECIAVLKELKKRDYREKWAYELAYLYHRAELYTECVEECDELILWFGEGTFVKKAMELKMLHASLTPSQQEKYDQMTRSSRRREVREKPQEPEIRVKPVDTSIYNTMNLQKELAMSLEAVLKKDKETNEDIVAVHNSDTGAFFREDVENAIAKEAAAEEEMPNEAISEELPLEELGNTKVFDREDIRQYMKLADGKEEFMPTLEEPSAQEEVMAEENAIKAEETASQMPAEEKSLEESLPEAVYEEEPEEDGNEEESVYVEEAVAEQKVKEAQMIAKAEAPSGFEELLSQEYDGQISLVVPEEETQDKQITGQLSIEDVLAEWERMKRENEQKRQEEVRQRVLEHTGNLMKEIEETVHEELENFEEFEEAQEEPEEESFEELEEILEPEELEAFDSSKEGPSIAGALGAAALAAGAVAATNMAVKAKETEAMIEGATEVAKDLVEGAANVVKEVVAQDESVKRVPYGANRYEEEDEPVEEVQPQKVTRIVQDYNELLYGEEEELPVDQLFEEAVEEETAVDETEEPVAESEEEAFDFEDGFDLSGMEMEDEPETSVESEVSQDSEDGEESEYDFMDSILSQGMMEETIEEKEQDSFEEEIEEIKDEVEAETEEEDYFGDAFLPDSILEDEPEKFVEDTKEEEEDSSEEESFDFGESLLKESLEQTNGEEQEEIEETVEEAIEETPEEIEPEEEPEEDDISKRMEALASKVFNPSGVYVPKEEPLSDTFTVVTPEMKEQMQEELLHPQIEEPVNEVTEEPVIEEAKEEIPEEPIAVMPMVTMPVEGFVSDPVTDMVENPYAAPEFDTFTSQAAMEAEVPASKEQMEMQEEEPSYESDAVEEKAYVPMSEEDQYSKALEEQLSAVAPESFTAIEDTFETMDQVSSLEEEEEVSVDNFYERQAELDRAKNLRNFTEAEERLYGSFLRTKKAKDQLIYAIDNISMASYTGNIIITGDDQKENLELARNLLKEVQQNDSNFSGVPGKISADSLNRKEVESILRKVENGAVIIENAGALTKETVEDMTAYLEKENRGIIVILIDHKMNMDKMLSMYPSIRNNFNARIDIEEMTSQELSAYGKSYAYEKEYGIDEMGMLALFTRIDELQTMGHVVMPEEVEKIVDEAIKKANRKNLKHFTDIILNKRYDEEDMIVLREKDF